jgi:hypothetical protein
MLGKVIATLRENQPQLSVDGDSLREQINVRYTGVKAEHAYARLHLEINTRDPALSQILVNTWTREYVNYVDRLYTTAMAVREIIQLGISFTEYEDNIEELSWQIKGKKMFLDSLKTRDDIAQNILYNMNDLEVKKEYYLQKQKEVLAEISILQKQLQNAKDIISEIMPGESPEAAIDGDIPTLLTFINDNGVFLKPFSLGEISIVSLTQQSKQYGIQSKAIKITSLIALSFILALFLAKSMKGNL